MLHMKHVDRDDTALSPTQGEAARFYNCKCRQRIFLNMYALYQETVTLMIIFMFFKMRCEQRISANQHKFSFSEFL